MAGKTEILGIGELRQAFAQLKDIDRGARRIVVAGGQVLKRKAKAIAQAKGLVRTGAMIKNIAIKRERTPTGEAQYNLGVRHGRDLSRKQKQNSKLAVGRNGRIVKRYENDPFYWRFHEFGTKKLSAAPFIEPALDQGKGTALDAMQRQAWKEVERQAKGKK